MSHHHLRLELTNCFESYVDYDEYRSSAESQIAYAGYLSEEYREYCDNSQEERTYKNEL